MTASNGPAPMAVGLGAVVRGKIERTWDDESH